jgi:hypothetical protein
MPRVKLRPVSFKEALVIGDGRFTLEHIPEWYRRSPRRHGVVEMYHAPQFRSDREWYDNTVFFGEAGHYGGPKNYHSLNYSWPLGMWVEKPYRIPGQRVRLVDTNRRGRVRL